MRKIFLLFSLFVLFAEVISAQDFSNKGKDFWLAYPAHIDGNSSRMALYISSDVSTAGSVLINGSTIPFAVTANQATVVQIFPGTYPVINSQDEGVKVGSGIHVIANAPVVVYAHILNAARSGSSMILPTNTLGREYVATSFRSSVNSGAGGQGGGSPSGSQFTIVGVENNTTVEIIPSANDVGNLHPAGVAFQVMLNQGDVYQYRTTYEKDVTGTKIRSLATATSTCRPIAVFSGSSWTSLDCINASGGDNLFQQLMPVNSWGKNFLTAPFADRQFDIFRIIVRDPSTQVTLNGTLLSQSSLINNTYYQFNSSIPNAINSDQPVTVVQYMVSQTCDNRNGDPEMIILNPIEQTINDVTVISARANLTPPNTNIVKHFFTIIIKTNSINSLRIDGAAPTASPVAIGTTGYSYLHENVTSSTNVNPSHRIKADSGFIALAYGMGNVESYGYNAGTNVKDLYQFVTIQNQYSTVNFPSTCRNAPFMFAMTFPYQPTSIKWVFGAALNAMGITDVTQNSPVADSSWIVNGKTLYRYKLPTPFTISSAGSFPIKVLAKNPTPDGCGGEQEIDYTVEVFDRPTADFSLSTSGCVTDSVRFTDNSSTNGRPSARWTWNFDDGQSSAVRNPSHLFSQAKTYNVRFSLVTDIGCVSDTIMKPVALSEPPVAKFGLASPACVGKVLTVVDSSTSVNGPITKWTWNFGDGSPAVVATTNAAQTHTYATTGPFIISLEVQSASGCRSLITKRNIVVSPIPAAAFSFSKACLPNEAVQFTDRSTIAGGQNNFAYLWKFGDGGTTSLKDPSYLYSAVGPYQATLIVTSQAGCVDSVKKIVDSIYAAPQAKFTAPDEICFGAPLNFTDQSTTQNSTVTGWTWNFDDGSPNSTQQNPTHTYAAPRIYNVSLSVKTAVGCSSVVAATKAVVVNPLPTADFSPSIPQCAGNAVLFTDQSLANAGTLTKWIWNFGDSSAPLVATTAAAQSHIYTQTGPFDVTLQVESSKGCVSTVRTRQIVINAVPNAGFAMPGNCLDDPVTQFTDSSSILDGSQGQFTYRWDFGDANATAANPNFSTAKDATHKFTATGDYNVKLVVTSNKGCSDSVTRKFTINGSVPVAAFSLLGGTEVCSNDSVRLVDNSSVAPGKLIRLEIFWDYNGNPTNKTVSTNPFPGARYSTKYPEFFSPATKTYRVKFIAYSGANCFTEKDTMLTLRAAPEINFPPVDAVCADEASFQLAASVTNMTNGTGTFSGRGVNSTGIFNPRAAGAGRDTVRFTYVGSNGCTSTAAQVVNVFSVPTVNAGPDRFVLAGGAATLAATASGSRLTYLWTPTTYLNSPAVLQPATTPADDVRYTLTVTSDDGCTASDDVFVKLLKAPSIPNVFTPNNDGINDRWEIQYLESYPGATVEIFNRYGSLVFRSIGYPKPWDGTYDGKPAPAGTYYYIINPKNGRMQIAGFVDIVR